MDYLKGSQLWERHYSKNKRLPHRGDFEDRFNLEDTIEEDIRKISSQYCSFSFYPPTEKERVIGNVGDYIIIRVSNFDIKKNSYQKRIHLTTQPPTYQHKGLLKLLKGKGFKKITDSQN